MVYVTIDPNDSDTVYTGNQRVYRTKNDGLSWDALTPVLDGSPISAIEVAPADSNAIYVGTENGGMFRSLDGGTTWSANLTGPDLPGVMVTRIETHPADASDVFLTVGNSGNSHVFRSKDDGSTWTDIDSGKLPDVPHSALLIRPDKPKELYVACDVGVFMTKDGGTTWRDATAHFRTSWSWTLSYTRPHVRSSPRPTAGASGRPRCPNRSACHAAPPLEGLLALAEVVRVFGDRDVQRRDIRLRRVQWRRVGRHLSPPGGLGRPLGAGLRLGHCWGPLTQVILVAVGDTAPLPARPECDRSVPLSSRIPE